MDDFEGRSAVVTGAASGIGLALVRTFLDLGMNVLMADIDEERLAAESSRLSGNLQTHRVDVSSQADLDALAAHAGEAFGPIHVLCNNAGVDGFRGGPLWTAPEASWARCMGINVMGIIHGLRAFLPAMLEHGQDCSVVNTCSNAVLMTPQSMYGVSKHYALAVTDGVRAELASNARVTVTALCPGPTKSRLFVADTVASETEPSATPTAASARGLKQAELDDEGLDPDVVAEKLVAGLRARSPYVFTDDRAFDAFQARFELMMAAPR